MKNKTIKTLPAAIFCCAAMCAFLFADSAYAQNIGSVGGALRSRGSVSANGTSGPQASTGMQKELEAAIAELYSNNGSPSASLIEKLKKLAADGDAKIAARAELELATAYVKKGDHARADAILKRLAADVSFEFRARAAHLLEYSGFVAKRSDLRARALEYLEALREAKKEFEATPVSDIGARLKSRFKLAAAAEKFRRSLAAYQAHTTRDGLKAFAGYAIDGVAKGANLDPDDPAIAEILGFEKRETAGVQRSPALASASGDILKVMNVRWGFEDFASLSATKPVWRTVSIDASAVSDVYFCLKPFPPSWLFAHAFLLFEFGGEDSVKTEKGERTSALALSVEPVYLKGTTYGRPYSKGPYQVVFQLSSREDYLGLATVAKSRAIYPFRLALSSAQKKELLKQAVEASWNNEPETNIYSFLGNNCINSVFMVINRILPAGRKYNKNLKIIFNPNVSTPQLCVNALASFGLLAEKEPAINLFAGRDAEARPASAEKIAAAKATISETRADFLRAVERAPLSAAETAGILFDDLTGTASCLYVPPTRPFADDAGGFTAGKDFRERIAGAGDPARLKAAVGSLFDEYSRAVAARMGMPGPDISEFVAGNMRSLKDRLKRLK